MGLWSKLFGGSGGKAVIVEGGALVIRSRELAATIRRPETANHSEDAQPPCEKCGRALPELLLTTGGPLGDPLVWRDVPVAVDGWACVDCGVFRYPRRMLPDQIVKIGDEGATHGRAGRVAEAELAFTRIAWDWPGYFNGHMNLAEATRDRLHGVPKEEEALRRRLVDRMVGEYERAVASHTEQPHASSVPAVARAYITLADVAIDRRVLDRARRMAEECLALGGVREADATRARAIVTYVDTRLDLFEARNVLKPYLNLSDRPGKPVDTGAARKEVVDALEKLEEHITLAPDSTQAAWLYAMGKARLGDDEATLETWRRVHERFPKEEPIMLERSLALLRAGRNEEARVVNRAMVDAHPNKATLWCNLAVTELLNGDIDRADLAAKKSISLDPKDGIARAVLARIGAVRAGAPQPRSLAELQKLRPKGD